MERHGLSDSFVMREDVLTWIHPDGTELACHLKLPAGRPPILRACLAAAGRMVADTTAGLGADGIVLAAAGCQVTAFERSPVAYLLLSDGLRRAALDSALAEAASRYRLHFGDARELLPDHGPFEVSYLDPMFEVLKPSAGKRKSMSVFHDLSGADPDAGELLEVARHHTLRRVVVKRHAKAPPLPGPAPSGSISGRTIRFDLHAGIMRTDN